MERGAARSSVRSRGSSSGASDAPARAKLADCCRQLVAFMCTQVGVGALVVGYTVVGAFAFQHIETREERPLLAEVSGARARCAALLWEVARAENVFDRTRFGAEADRALRRHQRFVADAIKRGYNGRTVVDTWSFPAALMFSLSIITMIGYGNLVPRTAWGKVTTVVYAVFGIPLYVLYFMNMGAVLAGVFRWAYTRLHECGAERPSRRGVVVPSSASLWVIGAYVATGAVVFAEWERWSYLDSAYFCVTSLCKIGLGDFVPGANVDDFNAGSQTKLAVNFVYMLVGLGLVAMCYNLMREEVRVKVAEWREDLGQCLEDTRARSTACVRRCR